MLANNYRSNNGDTLIEVLFATAVFSLIAVGGLSLMNQGTAASQRALEITLVRNEIDSQAETLRFLNASYIAAYQPGVSGCLPSVTLTGPAGQWQTMQCSIIGFGLSSASPFGAVGATICPSSPQGSFIIDTHNATFIPPASGKLNLAQTFSKVVYNAGGNLSLASGIWIEAVRSASINVNNQAGTGYIDFHIRACWDSPGQSVPATIGTIVRLYEPRG